MPLPMLAGVSWLGGLLISAFTALFLWFVQIFTKRLALVAAALVFIIGLTTALWAALEGLISGLTLALPSEFTQAIGLILPSNTTTCVAIMVSASMLKYAYDWNIKVIQYKLL